MEVGKIILDGISASDLIGAITEIVRKELSSSKEEDVLMTRDEVAAYLKVNLSTLSKWTNEKRFPCYGIGGRRYYKKSEINASMEVLQV